METIPGQFKDFIAMPKPNMYQSLHATVIGPRGEPFEIQIRTWEMHKIAEFGIAAHWKCKEGVEGTTDIEEKLSWLRPDDGVGKGYEQLPGVCRKPEDRYLRESGLRVHAEVVELPDGSTPVDFAYKIHSGVGNSCVGAKVDGAYRAPQLQTDQRKIVDIITAKNGQGPSRGG